MMGGSTALAVLLLAVTANGAMAATIHAADVGSNLGNTFGGWAKAILAPTVGLMGLAALFKRDVGHAVTLSVIAVIVGLFAYDPGGAQSAIHTIVKNLTGS
jgi:hypothetical protein